MVFLFSRKSGIEIKVLGITMKTEGILVKSRDLHVDFKIARSRQWEVRCNSLNMRWKARDLNFPKTICIQILEIENDFEKAKGFAGIDDDWIPRIAPKLPGILL